MARSNGKSASKTPPSTLTEWLAVSRKPAADFVRNALALEVINPPDLTSCLPPEFQPAIEATAKRSAADDPDGKIDPGNIYDVVNVTVDAAVAFGIAVGQHLRGV